VADRRGYTCGLWQLLHTLASRLPDTDNSGAVWLAAVKGFVSSYFQCTECAKHFVRHAGGEEAVAVARKRDAVLWMWRTHNIVSGGEGWGAVVRLLAGASTAELVLLACPRRARRLSAHSLPDRLPCMATRTHLNPPPPLLPPRSTGGWRPRRLRTQIRATPQRRPSSSRPPRCARSAGGWPPAGLLEERAFSWL